MKTKQSRRDFLKVTAAGALGTIVISGETFKTDTIPAHETGVTDFKSFGVGLQLYTIRDAMEKDVPGSLKKVSDTGYRYIELADYSNGLFYGYKPSEFRKMVNDMGMDILSSHVQFEIPGDPVEYAKKAADDHATLGARYCLQPWIEAEDRKTISSYQKMAAHWNAVGKIMKERGIQFGYHNHNFEFDKVDGKIPYFDVLMKELDKELITMELDLFWTTKSGQNPIKLFKKYPGRFQLFHMKDMFTKQPPIFTTDGMSDFAPVGSGLINFKEILAYKKKAGMKYMIVEQDLSKSGNIFDDIKTSIINLTTKILV